MPPSSKLAFLLIVLFFLAVLTIGALVSGYYLMQGYYANLFWFWALFLAFAAARELFRTYWTVIHTQSASLRGGTRYLFLQSLGMCLVPILGAIGNIIGQATGFNRSSSDIMVSAGAAVGALAGFGVYVWCRRAFPFVVSQAVIRGRTLMSPDQVQKHVEAPTADSARGVPWGGISLPESQAEGHFCVVGATGSGKTATMTQLMKAVLPRIGTGEPIRALIYDAKRDILSVLRHIGVPSDRIRILNPFDARSDAWDMAKDITSPSTTAQLATILVPKDEGPNRYFTDAARAILAGVMDAFILADTKSWTLRDVVVAMQDHDRLRELFARHPATRGLIGEYFNRKDTLHDVRSTVASHVATLKPIAALWSRSNRKVSLEEWASGQFILVLGNDDSLRAPLDAVNRVLFQRMSEILTRTQVASNGRTWVFLDELKEAGRLEGLSRLMTKGRSFGVRVVIGFQDISGLTTVYTEHGAKEIADLPMNKAFLRLDSLPTATWAAQTIGEAEVREFRTTVAKDGEHIAEQIFNRTAVLATELLNLPLPDQRGFHGFFVAPAVGAYRAHVPFGMPQPKPDAAFDFQGRDPREQYIDDWDDDDFHRLAFSPGPKPPPTQPPLPFAEPPGEPPENLMPRLTRDNPDS